MDCHDAKERVREERPGTAVRRHLSRCPDCRAYVRELSGGGRELSQAFLATAPSPGFTERVRRKIEEREIGVSRNSRSRFAAVAVPMVLLTLTGAALFFFRPEAPVAPKPGPTAPAQTAAITHPERENRLELFLWRERSDAETELLVRFAGESVAVKLSAAVEETLRAQYRRGARRVELRVSPEVPGHQLIGLIELFEKLGFSFEIDRRK
jgi:predicted anti-sigma-YlaC factor YlaD